MDSAPSFDSAVPMPRRQRGRPRKTLDELIKAYPKSEAAVAGKERLASLK